MTTATTLPPTLALPDGTMETTTPERQALRAALESAIRQGRQTGNPEETLTAVDALAAASPNLPEVWFARGMVLADLQRYPEAIASLDRALILAPNFRAAKAQRQQILQRQGTGGGARLRR
ncbi:MAG: tetratricopeptide repeat protein [Oscillatoriales cyanobacterium SM2_1_8]|nr:tetratricopeptide repeat protein [Oscillatoriales cyanobacterium SM2_1_8]